MSIFNKIGTATKAVFNLVVDKTASDISLIKEISESEKIPPPLRLAYRAAVLGVVASSHYLSKNPRSVKAWKALGVSSATMLTTNVLLVKCDPVAYDEALLRNAARTITMVEEFVGTFDEKTTEVV